MQTMSGTPMQVEAGVLALSVGAFFCVFGGYLLSPVVRYPKIANSRDTHGVSAIAKKATVLLFPVAALVAFRFFVSRGVADYGYGEGLNTWEQATLYLHLYFGLVFFATLPENKKKNLVILAMFLVVVIPRLLISLRWGRFFVAQAIVPILLILIARGMFVLNGKRVAILGVVAFFIVFIPAAFRGDDLYNSEAIFNFFSRGSTLILFQDNRFMDLNGYCEPIFVSLTAKIIPYAMVNECTIDIWGQQGLPATLDRILAYNEIGESDALVGPGSNYLLELYLFAGSIGVLVGSFFLGLMARQFVRAITVGSIFGAIWVESLVRLLLAPRSNFGYIFERIPSLFLTSLLFLFLVHALRDARE